MRVKGRAIMSLCVAIVAVIVVLMSLKWPFKTALFPIIIGIPVALMAGGEFLMSLRGQKKAERGGVDFKLSEDVDPQVALQRTVRTFAWIVGFFLLIVFFGFPIAIPLFLFLNLKFQARESWGLTLVLTVLTSVFFYGLFVRLLDIPFYEGWVLRTLGLI
jgi:hypothetical protein